MEIEIKFQLNSVDRAVRSDPRRPLLEVLREDLGLTGTKYGCGEGQCRACTVLIDGSPTPSCLTPVAAVQNKTVRTIGCTRSSRRLSRKKPCSAGIACRA